MLYLDFQSFSSFEDSSQAMKNSRDKIHPNPNPNPNLVEQMFDQRLDVWVTMLTIGVQRGH